jgi:hypothetical protein
MKRHLVLHLLILCVAFAAVDWVNVMGTSNAALPADIEVVESSSSCIHIRTAYFGFTKEDTTIDSKAFSRITIPEQPVQQVCRNADTMLVGRPQIPCVRLLVAIPDSVQCNVALYKSPPILFEDYLLYPVPRVTFEDSSSWMGPVETYAYDTSFYQCDTMYPNTYFEIHRDGHWRDQRVLEISLYPVQCNPGETLMYFYRHLDLVITYSGTYVENTRGLGPFEEIGKDLLLNYHGVDIAPSFNLNPGIHYYDSLQHPANEADYIIVTHEDFLADSTDSFWIHELAKWRASHNRFGVAIVRMQDIYDEFLEQPPAEVDSAKALRNFLQYAYHNWNSPSYADSHFAYCLLVGDWEYVPMETCFVFYSGAPPLYTYMNAYEAYFRNINADEIDFFEDIMLGRWPVNLCDQAYVSEVAVIAEKTITYESSPDTNIWRRRGLLICGPGTNYVTSSVRVDESKPLFSDIGYDTVVIRCDTSLTPEQYIFADTVQVYFNQGDIMVAFYDHGGPLGWNYNYGTWYAETLQNAPKLPFVQSYACNTGMFQFDHPYYDTLAGTVVNGDTMPDSWAWDTCFGECLLLNPDGGAVAFFGGTSPLYFCCYSTAVTEQILRHQHWVVGMAIMAASMSKQLYLSDTANCFCLLGDPALDIGDYTAYPGRSDLVVRPHGIDIQLPLEHPYITSGDSIPLQTKVWNIGKDTALAFDVTLYVVDTNDDTLYGDTIAVDTLLPRRHTVLTSYWDSGVTHPNHYGEIDTCTIEATADSDDEIDETWEYNNTSAIRNYLALYPNKDGWPKRFFACDIENLPAMPQPQLADIDGSSGIEIVMTGVDSVHVFRADGAALSGWPQRFPGVFSTALGDVDVDGDLDIVAVAPESVIVYDYQGDTLSGWPQEIPGVDSLQFFGFPGLGYVEGNRKRQVVLYACHKDEDVDHKPRLVIYDYDGELLYNYSADSSTRGGPASMGVAIAEVNNDSKCEMITSYRHRTRPQDQEICMGYTDIFNKDGQIRTIRWGSNMAIPALADLNSDTTADVVTAGIDDTIRAYDERHQDTLWKTNTDAPINSSPAIGDIHPLLSQNEVVFGNDSCRIYVLRGSIGQVLPNWFYITTGSVQTAAALAKLEGSLDGSVDFIMGTNDMWVYGLRYDTLSVTPYPLSLYGLPSSAVVGDIDGDQKYETVLYSRDQYLHVWSNVISGCARYHLAWPQYHHDYQRTGSYDWNP